MTDCPQQATQEEESNDGFDPILFKSDFDTAPLRRQNVLTSQREDNQTLIITYNLVVSNSSNNTDDLSITSVQTITTNDHLSDNI